MRIRLPSYFRSLTSLLTISLVLAAGGNLSAQVLLPDPAPSVITAIPYTITKAGFYQLGGHFVGTLNPGNLITIDADNVTLDFNGHSITGPADPSGVLCGICALDHNNIAIQHGKAAFCNVGTGKGATGTATSSHHLSPSLAKRQREGRATDFCAV